MSSFSLNPLLQSQVKEPGELTQISSQSCFPSTHRLMAAKHKGHLFSVSIIFHYGINISLNLGSVRSPFSFNVHQPYDVRGFGTYSTFNLMTIQFWCYFVISEQKVRCDRRREEQLHVLNLPVLHHSLTLM